LQAQFYPYCTPNLQEEGHCHNASLYSFIILPGKNVSDIITGNSLLLGDDVDLFADYSVCTKGYYCVWVINTAKDAVVSGHLKLVNPFGHLPAEDYPFLIFYGLLALVYLLVGLFWAILTACYWREILHVQNYISGVIFLCMLEMIFNFAYYASYNDTGISCTLLDLFLPLVRSGL